MSGRVGHRKRLICVNTANLRARHLYLTGHVDFFPADCYGPSSEKEGTGKMLRLDVQGLTEPVYTDIPTEAGSGKPRRFFRKRGWVREFFKLHKIGPGDTVAIEREGTHHYSIQPERRAYDLTIDTVFVGLDLA
jgi:DNA polymerase-3 subunit epsilon